MEVPGVGAVPWHTSTQSDPVRPRAVSVTQRVVRVAAHVVCLVEGQILLAHKLAGGPSQGKWTLPGGGVDFGEDPVDAAARECREETGLTPVVGRPLGVHSGLFSTSDGVETHSVRILFEGRFPSADGAASRPEPALPDGGEMDAVGWFPVDDLPSPVTETVELAVRVIQPSSRNA